MIRRPPRSTQSRSSAASDVYKRQTGKCPVDLNQSPVVDAGPDLTLPDLSTVAILNGQVSDDGLPTGSAMRVRWTKLAGPGGVTFGNATEVQTRATCDACGVYTLKLTASDWMVERSDLVDVRVAAACAIRDVPGLVAWWPANGNAFDTMHGLKAELRNGTTYTNGMVAGCFQFDGLNDHAKVPAHPALNLSPSG